MQPQNQEAEKEINKAKEMLIIVEGNKDRNTLLNLGFKNIFVINETGKSLFEKIEEIEQTAGKKKVCILTDFDAKGKKLYLLLKDELSKRKVRLDNSFRQVLLKKNVSHIEGLNMAV